MADQPRPGAPRSLSDAKIEEVITRTLESKPDNATHWSTRSMAQRVGLAQSAIVRIWHAFGLQPHKSETVKRWRQRHPRYQVHFTPTSASWLNQVERFFSTLTEKRIRRGVFRTVAALETAIRDYLAEHNRVPKPFVWTVTAELGRLRN